MQTQGAASAVQTSRRRVGKSGRRAASRANGAWRSLLLAGTCAAGMVARAAGRVIPSSELVDISAKISSDAKFMGAAAAGDGRVVFAPYKADGVGVFPPPPGTDWCTCCESKMTRLGLNVDRVCVLPPL